MRKTQRRLDWESRSSTDNIFRRDMKLVYCKKWNIEINTVCTRQVCDIKWPCFSCPVALCWTSAFGCLRSALLPDNRPSWCPSRTGTVSGEEKQNHLLEFSCLWYKPHVQHIHKMCKYLGYILKWPVLSCCWGISYFMTINKSSTKY